MRRLKIIEQISLDGVIQVSGEDGDFPYGDWTAPYRTPAGRGGQSSPRMARASICCLAVAPAISGRASGRRRRAGKS
jgi:hypothetical protein